MKQLLSSLILLLLWLFLAFPSPVFAANSGNFSLSLWVNPTTSVASKTLIGKAEEFRMFTNASGFAGCQIRASSVWQTAAQSSTNVLAVGSWSHVLCTYDLINLKVYVNGVLVATQALTSLPDDTAASLKIGQDDSASTPYSNLSGTIDEFKFFNYALTADDVKTEYNRGSSMVLGALGTNSSYQPNASNQEYCIPGDTSSCAAPVGRWDFEEGSGGTINDTSGNSNTGTWNGTGSKHWDVGKVGKAGKFNGSDDYVSAPHSASLAITGDITITAWVKIPNYNLMNFMVDKTEGNGNGVKTLYEFRINNDTGSLAFVREDNTTSYYVPGTTPVPKNQWVLVSVTQIGTAVKLYINGVQVDSGTITGTPTGAGLLYIGTRQDFYRYFNGLIDEVRIYNYARTPAQIAWDYNRGGPVGWWKMDECQGATAHDSSGTNNGTITIGASGEDTLGTCTTSSTAWGSGATGKRNSSLSFDGTDDKVTVATAITGVQSVAFWVKPATNTDSFMDLDGGTHYITASSGTISATGFSTPTIYVNGVSGGSVTGGAWNHVVVTTATSFNTTSSMTFGYKSVATADYLNGQIDDVRIFNYALTATQVKDIYNGGAVNFGPSTGSP